MRPFRAKTTEARKPEPVNSPEMSFILLRRNNRRTDPIDSLTRQGFLVGDENHFCCVKRF
jgi:hypothetical protein